MKPFYFSKLVIPIVILLGFNVSSFAQTSTYNYTGTQQTYVVPAGVTQLSIDATGGGGGYPYWQCSGTASYAAAGRVQCTLAVTPGTTLYIYVGGKGGSPLCSSGTIQIGGFNGGISGSNFAGASGGGTDIRLAAGTITTSGSDGQTVQPYTAINRIIVAGGGGGGADWYGTGGAGGGLIAGTGVVGTSGGVAGTGGTQSGGGVNGNTGSLGVGGLRVSYTGGGGGYWGGGSGTGVSGGGGGGSSYTDPALCTSVVHTQGYSGATGDGRVIITVLCTAPGTIVGTMSTCVGATTTLTNPTGAGGAWTSSNPAVATIGSGTGVVTGVSAGTATITYLEANPCGGVSATATVTINPIPGPVTGSGTSCTGLTTVFTNSASGGVWSSSNGAVASISGTGLTTGLAPGSTTITYTLPAGCSTSAPLVVNQTPFLFNVTGGGPYCVGGSGVHIGLDGSTSGINYQLFSGSSSVSALTGGGSALDYGLYTTPGSYTVLATNTTTGCTASMTGSATVALNPLPASIAGSSSVCVGATTPLTDPTPGGTWTSSAPAVAVVGFGTGIVTGVVAGTTTITYTLATTGCKTTLPFLVNSQPAAIGGLSSVCVGSTISLTDASSGGIWTSSNPGVATAGAGTGAVTGVNPGTSTITYTLLTGCNTSTPVVVNPLPTAYTLTGGGSYCATGTGVHVGLIYSSSGVNYQLFNSAIPVGTPVAGSNSGLDFGLMTATGLYTVVGSNPLTGCNNSMAGSVFISTNPLPLVYDVIGGGSYCVGGAGVTVGLNHTQVGMKYQLYNGTTAVGPIITGAGAPISFGSYTTAGTYTVMATNPVTGCVNQMNSSATITVNPLPTAYGVTGGGHYCAGGTGVPIGLAGSDPGTTYVLRLGSSGISSIYSFGGSLSFGNFTTAGTYSITATDGSGCTNIMPGTAIVVIDPLPVIYAVTGGGGYCAGGAGVHVGLGFSSTGIDYQLWYAGSNISTIHGSGSGLDFGIQSAPGFYTVIAVNTSTGCAANMSGTVPVNINPLPNAYNVTGGGAYCIGGNGLHIGTDLSDPGFNYQLFRGTVAVGTPVAGTGGALDFGLFTTPGTYTVVATNTTTGCVMLQLGSATISINTLPLVHTVSGGGTYCAGGAGEDVILNISDAGIDYELYYNGTPTTITLPGTGAALHYGPVYIAGTYTVVAKNPLTGCTKNMVGSAIISINPLPNMFNITGGGNYCIGGSGVHVGLDGSNSGISYQLYNIGGPVGSALAGTGTILDFGLKTTPGTYWVVARNPLTTCTNTMAGTAAIAIDPAPLDYPITGGGAYCAGGGGQDIGISGSDSNVNYQLYRGSVAVLGGLQSGTGASIDFGFYTAPGVYTIRATDAFTGCSKNMPGTAVITIIADIIYSATGGGNYCAGGTGVHVGLSGSQSGVSYQLWNSAGIVGGVTPGTGLPLDFGLATSGDVYIVVASNDTYGCIDSMSGSATVVVNPLPNVHSVDGGGSYCAGGTGRNIGLDMGDAGVNYQLYNGVATSGSPVAGGGAALDFGLKTAAGTYTVIGVNGTTGCSNNMNGSATITIKPLPFAYRDSITGPNLIYPGYYCAADSGVHIYLGGSDAGVKYQLWRGATMIGLPFIGSGGALDMGLEVVAGTYTITAIDTVSTCTNNMLGSAEVHIIPLPVVHNVTGGGHFCPGGEGAHIGLDGSEAGYYYLLSGTGKTSSVKLFGSGAALDFGLQDTVGTYTILANNVITTCRNDMFGSANISVDTIPTPGVTLSAFPGTGISVWHIDSMHAFVNNGGPNPTYQWLINGHVIAGATNASFTNHEFFNHDSVVCLVTASGPCGGFTVSKHLIIVLHDVSVGNVIANNGNVVLIPNPNKGVFTVKGTLGSSIDEEVSLEVTNMLGQVVYRNKVNVQNGNIEEHIQLGGNLANGMYMLNLRSGTQNTVFHFAIEQ